MSEKCKTYKFSKYEKVEIWAMSDLHIGHESFDEKEFDRYIEWVKEKPNRRVIGLGDYIENVSSGRYPAGLAFKSQTMNPQAQKRLFIEKMYPVRDKILCLISGNHDARTDEVSQIDVMEDIARELECDYLGGSSQQAWINIWFSKYKNYKLFVRHGSYAGKYPRNNLRGMINDYGEVADLILTGHGHQLKDTFELKNRQAREKIYKKRVYGAQCGSFLKNVSYAKSKGYLPTEVGSPILMINREGSFISTGLDIYKWLENYFGEVI